MLPCPLPARSAAARVSLALLAGVALAIWLPACQRDRRAIGAYPPTVTVDHAKARAAASWHPALTDDSIPWNSNDTMRTLLFVAATLKRTEYSHQRQVDALLGRYHFDCSGMVDWILQHSAPSAAQSVREEGAARPLAANFHGAIATSPTKDTRRGWLRIERVQDARPGDVIAWLRHSEQQSRSTGHVAILVHSPVRLPGYDNAYLLRIADSTSVRHANDTRQGLEDGGFGLGTIVVVVDERGHPVGYGWMATRSPRIRFTSIAVGRPLR